MTKMKCFRIIAGLFLAGIVLACSKEPLSNMSPEFSSLNGPKPLILVDGSPVKGRISNPHEVDIKTVRYRKASEDLTRTYGTDARNGVMFITTSRK